MLLLPLLCPHVWPHGCVGINIGALQAPLPMTSLSWLSKLPCCILTWGHCVLVPPLNVLFFPCVPQARLVRYICKQRQCKLSVAPSDRTPELNSYPRFRDWLDTFNVRPAVAQVCEWSSGFRCVGQTDHTQI